MLRSLPFLMVFSFTLTQCAPSVSVDAEQAIDEGVQIENGVNRGVSYTDSLGNDFNLRYIPLAITNETSSSLQLQIGFLKEYDYPVTDGFEEFKVIPLPEAWALDGVGITDSMLEELPHYIDDPSLERSLAPGENLRIAIGTLYPRPPRFSGVLPRELYIHNVTGGFSDCEGQLSGISLDHDPVQLGLKLVFGDSCSLIPCGQFVAEESNTDLGDAALEFSKAVSAGQLRTHTYDLFVPRYPDVLMLFETDQIVDFQAYSSSDFPETNNLNNLDGFILFVGTYQNVVSARAAFGHLKSIATTRIEELAGFAGLEFEQVQLLEKIRLSGGMIVQKDKYMFYLMESCDDPPAETSWEDYENLFLDYLLDQGEELEVINANCAMDILMIQSRS